MLAELARRVRIDRREERATSLSIRMDTVRAALPQPTR